MPNLMSRIGSAFSTAYTKATTFFWPNPGAWTQASLFDTRPARTGVLVTPETAICLSVAWACVLAISSDLGSLPWQVMRRRKGGGVDVAFDHPLTELLNLSPDGVTTAARFRTSMQSHALLWGNGYSEIVSDDNGQVGTLSLMSPVTSWVERTGHSQEVRYHHSRGSLPPDRVLHVAGLAFDGLSAYSPTKILKETLGLSFGLEAFASSYFGNGASPSGVIEVPGKVTQDIKDDAEKKWSAKHQGLMNANRVAILDQGAKFTKIGQSPEEAQAIEARKFQVLEVCRIWRVPPHIVMDLSDAHYANIEAAEISYRNGTIAPWAVAWDQEGTRKLLTREERAQGYFLQHDLAKLVRGDMTTRAERASKLFAIGGMSPNEVRHEEGLNPVPGGDQRFVPLNMVPLEHAHEAMAAAASPNQSTSPVPKDEAPDASSDDDNRAE